MKHEYIKLYHNNPQHQDWFVVNWCLGNTCNYSCSYCPAILHDGSNRWPDTDKIKSFITKIIEQTAPRKVYFEFTGGEVTLFRDFIEICKHCTDKGAKVGLISNGSRTLRWWDENKQYFDHVCLSYHPEFADAEHFTDVVKLLHNDLRVHVNIMMSPDKFDYCFDTADKIKNLKNITMALQPLIHDFGDTLYDYTAEQKQIIDQQWQLILKHIKYDKQHDTYRGAMKMIYPDGNEKPVMVHRFINEKTNDWSGWKCYAGVEQIIVDMNGHFYRGWCKVGGPLGKITDENLIIPTEPVTCVKTMCHCNFDIMSTKEK